MTNETVKIGPVQLLAIGFNPETKFEGEILDELSKLESTDTIRVLDLLFIQKDMETSDLIALGFQAEDMGSIVGKLLGITPDKAGKKTKTITKKANGNAFGLSEADIEKLGESLEPGTAAGVALIEHVWARGLKKAVRDKNSIILAEGFLTPETIGEIAMEIEEMEDEMGDQTVQNGKRAYN